MHSVTQQETMLLSFNLMKSSARNAKNAIKLGAVNTFMTFFTPIEFQITHANLKITIITMRNSKDSPSLGVKALN